MLQDLLGNEVTLCRNFRSKKHLEKITLLREVLADDENLDPDLQSEILAAESPAPSQNPTSAAGSVSSSEDRGQSAPPEADARPKIDPEEKGQLPSSSSAGTPFQTEDEEEEADDGDDDSTHMLATLAQMRKDQQQESSAHGEGEIESGTSIADVEEAEADKASRQSSANSGDVTDGLTDRLHSLPLDGSEQGKQVTAGHELPLSLQKAVRIKFGES